MQIGAGAREVLAVPGPGEVVAVYRKAIYVRLPGGIIALVGPGVPPGPLWIAGDRDIILAARLHDPVTAGDGWLEVAGNRLDLAVAQIWIGPLPDPAALGAAVPFALDVLAGGPPSSLLDEPWRAALRRAEAAVATGDDLGAAGILGGLGPGLTPAGDDALAGVLLARRALAGAGTEEQLTAVARAAHTTDLSAALLSWAARGQAVEPLHDLLTAVAAGDRTAAAGAAQAVASLGASSGADLLLGLRLGLSASLQLPRRSTPGGEVGHPRVP